MILKINKKNILKNIKKRANLIIMFVEDFQEEYKTLKIDALNELLFDIEIEIDQIKKYIIELEKKND